MDSSLLIQDMKKFLEKYTRFMTKDIYISWKLYQKFFSSWNYLYKELSEVSVLYLDNIDYQKVMDIKRNGKRLLRLHNKKYLKGAMILNESFFDSLYSRDKLDNTKRNIVLSEENSMVYVNDRDNIPLVVTKIKYLEHIKYTSLDKICVVSRDKNFISKLTLELANKNIHGVQIYLLDGKDIPNNGFSVITREQKYRFLLDYITLELFSNKTRFREFYQVFVDYLYLNKDIFEYDTFKDYHNYMYKRMFLSRKLSLKKYNCSEVFKRKDLLRTIKNEVVHTIQEVDIGNFLFMNCISYCYDDGKFVLDNGDIIYYRGGIEKRNSRGNEQEILLYSEYIDKITYLERLAYELVKRRYVMERVSEDRIYEELRNTTTDHYFVEFINHKLIPFLDYYKKNKSFKGTRLTDEQQKVVINIYQDYQKYLENNKLLEENEMILSKFKWLDRQGYKYFIMVDSDCGIPSCSYLSLIKALPDVELLRDNVKLLYEHRKYLYENKFLPIMHTYLNIHEIQELTIKFLKRNLKVINEGIDTNKKKVEVYLYDDSNRLLLNKNVATIVSSVLEENKDSNMLLALDRLEDINLIVSNSDIFKVDSEHISTSSHCIVSYEKILEIKGSYSYFLVPYLISPYTRECLLKGDMDYEIKVCLYSLLNKCKKGIFLLCPLSRRDELERMLSNLKNVLVYE